MANFIPLDQAAAMLGISVDKMNEMRSNHEVFGYKDGATWKFKMQELERVAAEFDLQLDTSAVAEDSGQDTDFELSDSSQELIQDDSASDMGSGLVLEGGDDIAASDKEVTDEEALLFGSSSLKLAGSSKKMAADGGTGDLLDDDQPQGKDSPSDTGKMLGDDDDLLLSEEDLFSDEISLQDSYEDSAELSSDFEDSDLVLEDSDSSGEVALDAGGSGVSLATNESGISLEEESLELGGSDIDSLELPEDDEMIVLDDSADPDSATVMQEDDFNLTPLEEAVEDDSSGSQIIALEDSEIYTDESSATILADSDDLESQPAMLEESAFAASDLGAAGLVGGAVAGAPAIYGGQAALPEAPFEKWQIGLLSLVAIMLILGGMVAYDLARNLWMPSDSMVSSGFVLDMFLKITGM